VPGIHGPVVPETVGQLVARVAQAHGFVDESGGAVAPQWVRLDFLQREGLAKVPVDHPFTVVARLGNSDGDRLRLVAPFLRVDAHDAVWLGDPQGVSLWAGPGGALLDRPQRQ